MSLTGLACRVLSLTLMRPNCRPASICAHARFNEVVDVCEPGLSEDDAAERLYQLLAAAHTARGSRVMPCPSTSAAKRCSHQGTALQPRRESSIFGRPRLARDSRVSMGERPWLATVGLPRRESKKRFANMPKRGRLPNPIGFKRINELVHRPERQTA